LNEAHKMIKYKLEGAPSKIRVQTSFQKAFVLLQASIGQLFLDDYTLRQEMSLAVEFASRMLSATEDFSKEESNNGQVALECMMLRRSLATSLWNSNYGITNQILGVGQKTASSLSMNGIKNFDDLLTKSSNEIEQACGRKSPFGQKLRLAASKIISGRLTLSGHLEEMDSKNNDPLLICDVSRDNAIDDQEKAIVKYTLVIYTDRAGGALLFRSDLTGPSSYRIICPSKFGRIYIRLVSNIVGLDSALAIDGNANVEKSHFSLTPPSKNKITKKKTSKRTNSSGRQNCANTMHHMVTGVDDLRIQKRKASTPSTSNKSSQLAVKELNLEQSVVTPSSLTSYGAVTCQNNNSTPKNRPRALSMEETGRGIVQTPKFDMDYTISQEPKRFRTQNRSSWQRQKKDQKSLQQRAFGSHRENPFSSFKFDPNECEKELEKSCKSMISKSHTPTNRTPVSIQSIIPTSTPTPTRNGSPIMNHQQRRSRFLTLARKKASTSAGSHLDIQRQEILRQKAQEQEGYARGYLKPNQCNKRFPVQNSLQNEMQNFDFAESRINPGLVYQDTRYNESFQGHNTFQYHQPMEVQKHHCAQGTMPGTRAGNGIQDQIHALSQQDSQYNNHSIVRDTYCPHNLDAQSEGQFHYHDALPAMFGNPFVTVPTRGNRFSHQETVSPDYHMENRLGLLGEQFDGSQSITQAQDSYEQKQKIPEGMIITVEGDSNEDKVNAAFESAFFG